MESDRQGMSWYQLDAEEVFQRLQTSEKGLTDEEVGKRLSLYGPNLFAREEKISKLKILLHQFKSPLIYILIIAAMVTLLLQEYIDAGVIMAVVILNAVIGYVQEFKAEESMRALKRMVLPKARVIRNGKEREIPSQEVVPGDIVLVASGGKVPADLRLLRTIELKVEEAALTGESVPVEKATAAAEEPHLTPGDQRNMAFMGTIVVSGRAAGIVVETGNRTILGQIAEEVRQVSALKTPLQEKMERFAKLIGIFVVVFSVVVLALGTAYGEKISEMFMVAVALAVSAIPEGLPVAVTIAMAIGVARMARRNAIVRKLPAVETLGSTTVICSDKTGTLTKNEMTVRLIYDGMHAYEITGSGYEPKGEILHENLPLRIEERKNLEQVLRIGLLCNESEVYQEDGAYKVEGDPTEGALIVSAMKIGLDPVEEKRNYPQLAILPFESERGYMATLHRHGDRKFIFVKGAPEQVLDMCTECMLEGGFKAQEIVQVSSDFARQGVRVLAMGFKEVAPDKEELSHKDIEEGIVYAGLQGMIDPARPEAIDAIEGCKQAGIRTIMITGDHAITAVAVSRKLRIGGDDPPVLQGKDLEATSDEELFGKVKHVSVYARVSPQHKLRITQQLLKHGEVVAVTGDGVNDAPALKAAHIGIAMGKTGTDVAKEASDMVLADDNFATIFSAVEEGRVVYDNIKKVTLFLVSCGFGELLAILATIVMRLPIPYLAVQILWLNLVTNGFQDVALAFEPEEEGILKRPPRSPRENILSPLMVQRTLLMGAILAAGTVFIFLSHLDAGVPLERARTAALTTMVFFQFYQAFNCRSETESVFRMSVWSNPFLLFSLMAAFFAQMAVLYVPALQFVFRTVPLTATEWLRIALVASTVVIAVEIDKLIRRRKSSPGVSLSSGSATDPENPG
jgi:Ca2+-transporting ATPase